MSGSEGHPELVFEVRSFLGAWCPSGGGVVDAELDMVGIAVIINNESGYRPMESCDGIG